MIKPLVMILICVAIGVSFELADRRVPIFYWVLVLCYIFWQMFQNTFRQETGMTKALTKFYPTQVLIYEGLASGQFRVSCRPDALYPLCAEILEVGGRSAPVISIGSVEHRDEEIASFMLTMHVPPHLDKDVRTILDKYKSLP